MQPSIFNTLASHIPQARYQVTAPGRVNLLGEHVDYNDGWVLPAAIDRAVHLLAAPRPDRRVRLHALDLGQSAEFDLDALDSKRSPQGEPLPSWALYPAGVAWALAQRGLPLSGVEAVFQSNVPIGAGLSSSAAVEVAFAALWRLAGGWEMDNMTLAQVAQAGEIGYVGVNCGLMDQFASANGVVDHAVCLDTRTLAWEVVPLPAGSVIVVADSGVRRSLATSAYNERRAACEDAVRRLQAHLPAIRALRDVSSEQFAALSTHLPALTARRARHVITECERVQTALELLKSAQAAPFGQLMYAGHASLRDDYEVSCPELDTLVEIARTLPGCWGARLTGAGFGGCTVNLVAEDAAQAFITELREQYQRTTGRSAEVYLCRASQGVTAQTV